MTAAFVVWALMLAFAWFASESEPVCEGPLILGADDSSPPKCDELVVGLVEVGPVLLGLVLVFGLLGFLATAGLDRRRRRRTDVASDDDD